MMCSKFNAVIKMGIKIDSKVCIFHDEQIHRRLESKRTNYNKSYSVGCVLVARMLIPQLEFGCEWIGKREQYHNHRDHENPCLSSICDQNILFCVSTISLSHKYCIIFFSTVEQHASA